MNPIQIRNMKLGEGVPKICVPLTDTNLAGLQKSVPALTNAPCDLVEWRADFYETINDSEVRRQALTFLRDELKDTPLLFTIRTDLEGGTIKIDTETYTKINLFAIASGMIDMVDVEISRGDETVRTIIEAAHEHGVAVVGSRHDFSATPSKQVIVDTLCRMQNLGCDVAKFAVMPQSERDVLTLFDATLTMKEEHYDTPIITMSMGRLGAVSRVCGQLFGSALTFGTIGKASAPGQLPSDRLAEFLKNLS